jgi:hypothetical protein
MTALACERARQRGLNDPWLKPTLLLAAFNAGDVPRAKQLAREIRREGPEAWQLETTMADLKESVALNSGDTAAALARVMEDLEQTITLQ